MKERSFRVTAGPINERGYAIVTEFQELEVNNKRQPSTIFVLGMLPGEVGIVKTFKSKREIFYANILNLEKQSTSRVEPKDKDSYLASSPLQILKPESELELKTQFISNLFNTNVEVINGSKEWGYRNKVEFGFYEDYDNYNLNLSFFKREGGSGKYILEQGTAIADPKINELGLKVVEILRSNNVIGKHLKTLMIRSTDSEVVGNLYVTIEDFFTLYPLVKLELNDLPISIIFSDKKSPASINNGVLKPFKNTLNQSIGEYNFELALDGFFQVNIELFEIVIKEVKSYIAKENIKGGLLDFYCGVGVIGQMLNKEFVTVTGVDSSPESEALGLKNAINNNINNFSYFRSEAEKIVELISSDKILFLDPPRIGCNQKVIDRINEVLPEYIFYLSCNPISQHRDYMLLEENYSIEYIKAFNFYPKTPHLENLIILKTKNQPEV
jgi:23S rRNA (uracil1939-C5)-methyltransferase